MQVLLYFNRCFNDKMFLYFRIAEFSTQDGWMETLQAYQQEELNNASKFDNLLQVPVFA